MKGLTPGRQAIVAALATGILLTLAFPLQFWSFAVPPRWQGYSAWLAYAPLIWAGQGVSARRMGLLTGLSGWVYFTATIFWVVVAMVEYGGVPSPLAVLVLGLLALILGSFHAVAGFLAARMKERSGLALAWTFPIALTALELVRNYLFTGFPWSNIAYSQSRFLTLIQIADLTGIYGLTFLVSLAGAGLGNLLLGGQGWRRFGPALTALLGLLSCLGYGHLRISTLTAEEPSLPTVKVALLQGNIPQDEKWQSEKAGTILETYRGLTSTVLAQGAQLVVWPEASVPDLMPAQLTELPPEVFPESGPGTVHIIGAPTYLPRASGEEPFVMYNSAFMVDENRQVIGRYDKSHLVPFGEYVPLQSIFFFLGPIVQAVGSFLPGQVIVPLKDPRPGSHAFGVLICYEDIFPEIARQLGRGGAELLVNVTNDAWYGPTSALQQHLDMAVFRAIENRTWVARAANTGISAFVTRTGAVAAQTQAWQVATLVRDIPVKAASSPYLVLGDAFAALTCLLLLGGCLLPTRFLPRVAAR